MTKKEQIIDYYEKWGQSLDDMALHFGLKKQMIRKHLGDHYKGKETYKEKVMELYEKGYSNYAIAKALGITAPTVKWHLTNKDKKGMMDRPFRVGDIVDLDGEERSVTEVDAFGGFVTTKDNTWRLQKDYKLAKPMGKAKFINNMRTNLLRSGLDMETKLYEMGQIDKNGGKWYGEYIESLR